MVTPESDSKQDGGTSNGDEDFSYKALLETDDPETVSTLLTTFAGASGTVTLDRKIDESANSRDPQQETAGGRLEAYFQTSDPESVLEIRRRIRRALEGTDLDWRLRSCELFTDESWKHAWREFFEPLQLSERVNVGPPWLADEIGESGEADIDLIIEPAMAFGTGNHATTQLSAQMLDEALAAAEDPPQVLDVGCGSAILSMLAAKLGAARVVGVDISEDAIVSARENLQRNDVTEGVDLSTTPLAEVDGRFDIVVANILDPILLELRDELLAHVRPDGRLILSGITTERRDGFIDGFLADDWTIVDERVDGEWVALEVRRG